MSAIPVIINNVPKFIIVIENKDVHIFKSTPTGEYDGDVIKSYSMLYPESRIMTPEKLRIVGTPEDISSTILISINHNEYVYIGETITHFFVLEEIKRFEDPYSIELQYNMPMFFSKSYIYCLRIKRRLNIKDFNEIPSTELSKEEALIPYSAYYNSTHYSEKIDFKEADDISSPMWILEEFELE